MVEWRENAQDEGKELKWKMISWLALLQKWKEELRIEKNGGGMSWETCRKADYLDDDGDQTFHVCST